MPHNELLPEDPGYEYSSPMSLLPVKRKLIPYAPGKGPVELAVPGFARSALNDLWTALTAPANALGGQYTEEELPEIGMRAGTGLAMMGAGMSAPSGAMGIFAGRRAATADTRLMAKAMHLESQGYSPDMIRGLTGWFKDVDKKWKFEIPDSEARWKDLGVNADEEKARITLSYFGKQPKLGELIEHPELFKAYPDLANVEVTPTPLLSGLTGLKGYFDPEKNRIALTTGKPKDVLSTTLHETQHAVQHREGFASGGNIEEFLPEGFAKQEKEAKAFLDSAYELVRATGANPYSVARALEDRAKDLPLGPYYSGELARVPEEALKKYDRALQMYKPFEVTRQMARESYENLAGEVEARNVQERFETNEYDRPPWMMEGYIPQEKQIVRFGPPGSGLELEPIDHNPWDLEPVAGNPFEEEKE